MRSTVTYRTSRVWEIYQRLKKVISPLSEDEETGSLDTSGEGCAKEGVTVWRRASLFVHIGICSTSCNAWHTVGTLLIFVE